MDLPTSYCQLNMKSFKNVPKLFPNYLAGTDPKAIRAAAREILSGKAKRGRVPPLWDGHAADRIAVAILDGLLPARSG